MSPSLRFILFALVLGIHRGALAGSMNGYDTKTIEAALKGKKIVVPGGCPEEPRLNEGIGKLFAYHFPGVPEDDSGFRARVTKSFLAGLAKTGGSRIEIDSQACRTGPRSKLVTDIDGHSAMLDGGRISNTKAYLALGMFLYESPEEWEKYVTLSPREGPGQDNRAIGVRLSYGVYDTQERLLVYYDTEKVRAVDDLLVIKIITPEHWEKAAFKVGEKIGSRLSKLPGK
jgi:hypothetical protein